MEWLEVIAWGFVVLLSIPLVVLGTECFAAVVGRTRASHLPPSRPRSVVLIPAHNEELVIANTLRAVVPQLGPDDRILVVADNCTDRTAAIAREQGAEVIERFDTTQRGKGYALAFGRDSLKTTPPDVVIVLDADCTLGEATLFHLVTEAMTQGKPVQAANRMVAPVAAGPNRQVAAFAFLIKNVVRPSGLRRLGLPCLLTGTGMALPWTVIRDAPLAHGHIVEDMGLTVDLALLGWMAAFVPEGEVLSEFPVDDGAAHSQRRRWEHGHLQAISVGVPRLLVAGVTRARLRLLALALEVGVPPLSALVMVVVTALAALGIWVAVGGSWGPVAALGGAFGFAALGLLAAWWRYGRRILPASSLLRIPLYAVKKLSLYLGFIRKPQQEWVRTARETPPSKP